MKYTYLILITILLSSRAFSQQTVKADDALLLDYYQNQRFAEAADYLKRVYPETVTDVKVLSGLAYSSEMAGRLPEAEDYYQRIYLTDTANNATLFNLAIVTARRGNNAKAIGFYKKILQKDSSNFNVYKQMASLSRGSGNISDEMNYLTRANKLNAVEPDVAYDLSALLNNLKLHKKADTIVTAALRADTANMLLLLGKAQIDYRLSKFPETVQVCNRLIQSGNQTDEVINMLGNSYYALGKYNDCIATLKKLETSNTASETSYYYMAMRYKALNDEHNAITYFDKSIQQAISANVNSYYGEMADSYDHLHLPKKAVNAYQKSLLYGAMPLTYYALANLYDTELKNKALALRYYKKYLACALPDKQISYKAYAKRRAGELSGRMH